jgi:hypothetical protein
MGATSVEIGAHVVEPIISVSGPLIDAIEQSVSQIQFAGSAPLPSSGPLTAAADVAAPILNVVSQVFGKISDMGPGQLKLLAPLEPHEALIVKATESDVDKISEQNVDSKDLSLYQNRKTSLELENEKLIAPPLVVRLLATSAETRPNNYAQIGDLDYFDADQVFSD